MKKLLPIIVLFLLLLIPNLVFGADYTVSQSGAGKDYSAATFNSESGDFHGDTFYFSGTFTTRLDATGIYGTSEGQVTYDGYQAGSCDPINDDCADGALLNYGLVVGDGSTSPSYVTIQDFQITNQQDGNSGLYVGGLSNGADKIDHAIIQRNYVFETNGRLMTVDEGEYIVIKNNKIINFGQNSGEPDQGIDLVDLDHTLVSGNEFGHDEDNFPSGCTSAEIMELHRCWNILIEYNDMYGAPNQSLIRPKENGDQGDHVYRFNKLHDSDCGEGGGCEGYGIHAYGAKITPLYIYGNFIYDSIGVGILLEGDDPCTNYIWSNLIIQNGRSYPPNACSGMSLKSGTNYVYNNTFARNGFIDNASYPNKGGLMISAGTSYVKNNLFVEQLPGGDHSFFHAIYISGGTFTLEHNTYYHSSSTDHFYYNGAKRNLAYMNGEGYEQDAPIGMIENPTFTNPDGTDTTHGTDDDDYTLQSGSPSIDDGVDLSGYFDVDFGDGDSWFETNTGYESPIRIYLDEALNPATVDWEGDAKDLADNAGNFTVMQDLWGEGWERGAYAYPTSGLTITVSATDAMATEAGPTTGEWTISCSPNCAGETINFAYSGTAAIDTDYNTDDETGDIVINGPSTTITLTPVDDSDYDPGEVAILTILVGTGYAVGSPNQASISIVDNDSPPAAGNPLGQLTMDSSGSGSITYNSSGSGSWTR